MTMFAVLLLFWEFNRQAKTVFDLSFIFCFDYIQIISAIFSSQIFHPNRVYHEFYDPPSSSIRYSTDSLTTWWSNINLYQSTVIITLVLRLECHRMSSQGCWTDPEGAVIWHQIGILKQQQQQKTVFWRRFK